MKLDNVEVTHEEVNDAINAVDLKKEEPYDSREYIYEDEYNQQQSANNNFENAVRLSFNSINSNFIIKLPHKINRTK